MGMALGDVNNLKGEGGWELISDTVARTGMGVDTIDCIDDTVFAVLTAPGKRATSNAVTGVTFPAGTRLFAHVTALTLTSGRIIAYTSV